MTKLTTGTILTCALLLSACADGMAPVASNEAALESSGSVSCSGDVVKPQYVTSGSVYFPKRTTSNTAVIYYASWDPKDTNGVWFVGLELDWGKALFFYRVDRQDVGGMLAALGKSTWGPSMISGDPSAPAPNSPLPPGFPPPHDIFITHALGVAGGVNDAHHMPFPTCEKPAYY